MTTGPAIAALTTFFMMCPPCRATRADGAGHPVLSTVMWVTMYASRAPAPAPKGPNLYDTSPFRIVLRFSA